MTSRQILSSSLLAVTLVLPAAAQPTGERALLNRSEAPAAAPAAHVSPERKVEGEQALLNRPAARETVIAPPPSVIGGRPSADFHQVNAERALLGRTD